MDSDLLIPLVAIVSLFIVFPGMVFHYVTLWRKQKTLEPDDERMLEDLWRSAKRMERRIETLEKLVDNNPEDTAPVSRQPRSSYDQ